MGDLVTTMGVEEEFLLVDPRSGATAAAGAAVLARAAAAPGRPPGSAVHAELFASQVEAATGVCVDAAELREHLVAGRATLAAAAHEEGVALVASGVPPLGPPATIADGYRYDVIRERFGGVIADYESCGLHVHVGVPDRETAVAVLGHVRPWLPTLLALSGNSPYSRGVDTGYASWRMVLQSRFPGSGLPPVLTSAADHDERVARLVACGVLADERQTFWLARPSPRWPTVEFRVADTAATIDEAVLQAVLSRALVRTALDELARGRAAPSRPADHDLDQAAVWSAARHGMRGEAVDLARGRVAAAAELARDLVTHVTPALADAGDLDDCLRTLAAVLRHGTGADRQRAAGGPAAALRLTTVTPPGG